MAPRRAQSNTSVQCSQHPAALDAFASLLAEHRDDSYFSLQTATPSMTGRLPPKAPPPFQGAPGVRGAVLVAAPCRCLRARASKETQARVTPRGDRARFDNPTGDVVIGPPVPEPGTLALLFGGLAIVGTTARRRCTRVRNPA